MRGINIVFLKYIVRVHDSSIHSLNATTVHCSFMFRLLQSNHRQGLYRIYKKKLFPFLKCCIHPDYTYFEVAETCSCNPQSLH